VVPGGIWLCSTSYGPVLADHDISKVDPLVSCEMVVPASFTRIGNHFYVRLLRTLLELFE